MSACYPERPFDETDDWPPIWPWDPSREDVPSWVPQPHA